MLDNYNERLFNGKTLRSKLHLARYFWVANKIKQYQCKSKSVIELGCFDGKMLEFLETPPERYEGYDANWEGGLDIGKERWKAYPNFNFHLCTKLTDFNQQAEQFDLSICQETIEHLPLADTKNYIKKLAEATTSYCFISVPNELGFLFLGKHWFKALTQKKEDREDYSYKEIFYTLIGNTSKVERHETGHKGFNYKDLRKELEKHFDIIDTAGLPFERLPVALNFTVGFFCKRKSTSSV